MGVVVAILFRKLRHGFRVSGAFATRGRPGEGCAAFSATPWFSWRGTSANSQLQFFNLQMGLAILFAKMTFCRIKERKPDQGLSRRTSSRLNRRKCLRLL